MLFRSHLDARGLAVEQRHMAPAARLEVAAQQAVEVVQQVEVEGGGDAGRIVIGADQRLFVLDPVHADQQVGALAQRARGDRLGA